MTKLTWGVVLLMIAADVAVIKYAVETRQMVQGLSMATFRLLHDEGK